MWSPAIEDLAQELKSLIGPKAKPQHVLARPTLRDLVARQHPGLAPQPLAQAIIHELAQTAATFPDELHLSYRQLLAWEYRRFNDNAPTRRWAVILRHGYAVNVETFRRAEGDEMELCRQFARVMYERLAEVAA